MPDSYIGAVQIDSGDQILIGSTLFGICATGADAPAKVVTLSSFDQLLNGVTIQVKFTNGNTVANGLTLQVNTTDALNITGNCICDADQVIAFTYENVSGTRYWRSHHNISGAMPVTGGEFTGPVTLSTDIGASSPSLSIATKKYVDDRTAGLSGLTGAMHFKGEVSTLPSATATETFNSYDAGDVVLLSGSNKEYVYAKGNNAATSAWIELGDESSYALKSSTDTITEVASQQTVSVGSASGWNAGGQASLTIAANTNTAASLTENPVQIPNVTNAGTATTASVAGGILNITIGAAPTIAATPITVKEIGTFTPNVPIGITFTPNTLPQLTVTPTDTSKITTSDTVVVVPDNTPSQNP